MEKSEDFFKKKKSVENWRLEKPRKKTHTRFKAILAREKEEEEEANWVEKNLASRKKPHLSGPVFFWENFCIVATNVVGMFLEKFRLLGENFALKNENNRKTLETAE